MCRSWIEIPQSEASKTYNEAHHLGTERKPTHISPTLQRFRDRDARHDFVIDTLYFSSLALMRLHAMARSFLRNAPRNGKYPRPCRAYLQSRQLAIFVKITMS
jgi:hypothetical protein